MKFWDTSAIIPLLVKEENSSKIDKFFLKDSSIIVWWGTSIECVSAISRLEREDKVSAKQAEEVIYRLNQLQESWREIQPVDKLKKIAERILRLHPLRTQDAQQLAACVVVNMDQKVDFLTLDERLAIAARKEGLPVA